MKKEADSDISDEVNDIEVVKEVPGIPPDLLIQGETEEIEVHSRPFSQNPITDSLLDVDKPLNAKLSKKVFKFWKGHNLHSLFATWGQIDQYCTRKQRLIRLMAVGND